MKVIQVRSIEEMGQVALREVLAVVKRNSRAVLGLATGSSPIGLYHAMIKDHQKNKTSYANIRTINLDEYVGIESSHSQSYRTFMNEHLFNHIDINPKNIHLPVGNGDDLRLECERYERVLQENNVDLQILGIGSNGHIAFNEPGTSFHSRTHVVTLDERTRQDNARFFNHLDEVPKYAITMGIESILRAKQIVLIAMGKNKAKAVAHMIGGSISTDCPASVLQLHPNVVVIADEEALSELKVKPSILIDGVKLFKCNG